MCVSELQCDTENHFAATHIAVLRRTSVFGVFPYADFLFSLRFLSKPTWAPCHGWGLKSNEIVVVTPLQRGILQQVTTVKGWCLVLSSVSMRSTFQYHDHWSVGVKALGRSQLDISDFCGLHRCCLSQQVLTPSLWGTTKSLSNSLGCLAFHGGPLGPIAQIDVTHPWHWRFHLVVREIYLGLYLPHYLVIPFRFLSYMYIF